MQGYNVSTYSASYQSKLKKGWVVTDGGLQISPYGSIVIAQPYVSHPYHDKSMISRLLKSQVISCSIARLLLSFSVRFYNILSTVIFLFLCH